MPTSQDAVIEEAFGQRLPVLYARAAAGTATPAVHRALELRSFLAVVEDRAKATRARIHQATGTAAGLYELSTDDLRFDVSFLDASLRAGRKYVDALQEFVRTLPDQVPSRRPVSFSQHMAPARAVAEGGLTAQAGAIGEAAGQVRAGRHRR